MYPEHRFGISVLAPVHKRGNSLFSCGAFSGESIFQNIVAVAYALKQINSNFEGVGMGAIFFDYCDRSERAREQVFRYFSDEDKLENNLQLTPEKIVASLSFDDDTAESVSSILSSKRLPHFSSPVSNVKRGDRKDASIITSVPSRSAELYVYLSLLKTYNWKYVSIIFDNDSTGKFLAKKFKRIAKDENICIGDTFGVHKIVSEEYAQELILTMSDEWKPKIIILLVADVQNIRTILETTKELGKHERFIFIAGPSWGNNEIAVDKLETAAEGAITITLETYDLPDFRVFLSNLTLASHDPIPNDWFEEYYQNKFSCYITGSKHIIHHTNPCDMNLKVHADDIVQDPYVFHTILSVNSVAHGIESYMRKQCSKSRSIEDCTVELSDLFLEIGFQGRVSLNKSEELSSFDKGGAYGFHLWNYRKIGGSYAYTSAGKWKNGEIELHKNQINFKAHNKRVPISSCTSGTCLDICSSQSPVYAAMMLPKPLPLDINFRTAYGITTSALSMLGIVMILVTIVYFMMSFPTAAGTSVLGYLILIGCLILYASNLAFIFQPTIGTCAARRFVMGFGYAVKFSAMLVKVLHTWRLSSCGDSEDYVSFTRPGVLFLVSMILTLIQVILAAAWLILYPPSVDLLGESWRCTPTENFESDLIISLVYVMILITATILFSLETWQTEENAKETRWILVSSLFTAFVWVIWTIVATKAPYKFRDPAIVIANLATATTTVLFLYARKLYITSQLSKDMRDLELRSHFTAASSIYNASLAAQKHDDPNNQQLFHELSKSPINDCESLPGRQFVG